MTRKLKETSVDALYRALPTTREDATTLSEIATDNHWYIDSVFTKIDAVVRECKEYRKYGAVVSYRKDRFMVYYLDLTPRKMPSEEPTPEMVDAFVAEIETVGRKQTTPRLVTCSEESTPANARREDWRSFLPYIPTSRDDAKDISQIKESAESKLALDQIKGKLKSCRHNLRKHGQTVRCERDLESVEGNEKRYVYWIEDLQEPDIPDTKPVSEDDEETPPKRQRIKKFDYNDVLALLPDNQEEAVSIKWLAEQIGIDDEKAISNCIRTARHTKHLTKDVMGARCNSLTDRSFVYWLVERGQRMPRGSSVLKDDCIKPEEKRPLAGYIEPDRSDILDLSAEELIKAAYRTGKVKTPAITIKDGDWEITVRPKKGGDEEFGFA